MLRHGADVNFQNSKGLTALHLVIRKNSDRRHVEMLLRHGADPRIKSKDGVSPMDLLSRRRDKTSLNLFLSSRALRE
jgi:ankyrin repeat protein